MSLGKRYPGVKDIKLENSFPLYSSDLTLEDEYWFEALKHFLISGHTQIKKASRQDTIFISKRMENVTISS